MNRWILLSAAGCWVLGMSVCTANPLVSYDWPLRLPTLSLPDANSFSFASAFERVEMVTPDFLNDGAAGNNVNLPPILVKARHAAPVSGTTDPSKDDVSELRRPLFDYVHGEVGFMYGRSTGRFARDLESGYLSGTVGNEHMQISAGAAYENVSGGRSRFGR